MYTCYMGDVCVSYFFWVIYGRCMHGRCMDVSCIYGCYIHGYSIHGAVGVHAICTGVIYVWMS